MIVKNEENNLSACLDSVKTVVDEIIIIDTGSTDKTKERALEYTDKVYDFEWKNDFSEARNYSFSQATMPYILWLDADDILLAQEQKKIEVLKLHLDNMIDAYSMIYHYAFDEYGNVNLSFRRNRLVKRSSGFKWRGRVHEYLSVSGVLHDTDICVTHKGKQHHTERNIGIYREQLESGKALSTRDLYYYAKELYIRKRYVEAIDYLQRFLEKGDGGSEDIHSAYQLIANYYYHNGDYVKCRRYCFFTFKNEPPRSDICCLIGNSFMKQGRYTDAIFWHELAAKDIHNNNSEGWKRVNPSTYTWLPNLQLCVCYFQLGEIEEACRYNEIAAKYAPQRESILKNRAFFDSIGVYCK